MSKRPVLTATLVIVIASLACRGLARNEPMLSPAPPASPATSQPVPPSPTPPDPSDETQPGGEAAGTDKSGADGQVEFQDPVSDNLLTVTLKDEQTGQPVEDIETWFVSNGTEVLVIAHDPSNRYADTIRELKYAELSFEDDVSAKLASPGRISLAATLALVAAVNLYQDFLKLKAFVDDLPDLETWSKEEVQLCVTPEQARQGAGLGTDLLIGLVTRNMLGDEQLEEGIEELFGEFGEEGAGTLLERYASMQTPSIMRFTLFSIREGFPRLLAMDGFCLEPLDRREAGSALRWLLYGIHEQELYPFRHLMGSDFHGYANYIEGGDPVSAQEFLQDLAPRLESSQVSCDGYESSDGVIRVWTKGWSPAWQMTRYCYVDCGILDPPYESDSAGFFLYNVDGEWTLNVNYVNEPENYYFFPYELISCAQPEQLEINASQTPDLPSESSCPGAPPQRMEVDEEGFVCTQSDNVFLRNAPSRSAARLEGLPPGTTFRVTGGPQCADDWSWWQIRTDGGLEGWVSEGGDEVDPYFICPAP